MNNLDKFAIVFDLDDTLYAEEDYVISGIKFLEIFLSNNYEFPEKGYLLEAYFNGEKDFLELACKKLKLSRDLKQSLLWLYRLHNPNIELFSGIKGTLDSLFQMKSNVSILTDGRSVTQRLKVKSLGLNNLPIYISEEYSSEKPDKKRFLKIQKDFPNKKYVYIADNPVKDFKAPLEMDWICIGANWIKNRIHKIDLNQMPKICLNSPNEIEEVLLNLP